MARLGGLSGGLVDEVVRKLVKYEFFDGFVFSEYNILTSKNIQKVYLEASKRRKDIDLSQYWLLDEVNVYINSPSSKINAHINAQNKEKESKVNNISLLEKEKQKSVCVEFGEGEKNNQPLNAEKETSPQVAPAPPPFNFRKAMLNEGFAPELVDEWLKIRKAKKAINSELALKTFIEQVRKTNQDINAILSIIVQKQWKGFEADWLHNTQYHQPIANNQIIIDENGKIITNAEPYGQQSTVSKPPYFAGRQTLENIRNNSQGWGAHIVGDS